MQSSVKAPGAAAATPSGATIAPSVQAAVSQQLARLRFDRLVMTRREGRNIYYSIATKEVSSVVGTLYGLFCGVPEHN